MTANALVMVVDGEKIPVLLPSLPERLVIRLRALPLAPTKFLARHLAGDQSEPRAEIATTLAAPDGGFDDADAGREGLLAKRRRPLEGNAVMARAQLAAGDRAGAERTLAAFAGSYLLYGTQAASYARAVDAWSRAAPARR